MTRQVDGLMLAWESAQRPAGIPVARVRGRDKKAGLVFERALGGQLPKGARQGVWWGFRDQAGTGWCQTDWIVPGYQSVLVLECKLGQTWEAWKQLEGLYGPVVAKATGKSTLLVQVCKFLRPDRAAPGEIMVGDLEEALRLAKTGRRVVLHWSGLGPLVRPGTRGHGQIAGVLRPEPLGLG